MDQSALRKDERQHRHIVARTADRFLGLVRLVLNMQYLPDYKDLVVLARTVIFEHTEIWHNRQHLHFTLGYRSPVEFKATRTIIVPIKSGQPKTVIGGKRRTPVTGEYQQQCRRGWGESLATALKIQGETL